MWLAFTSTIGRRKTSDLLLDYQWMFDHAIGLHFCSHFPGIFGKGRDLINPKRVFLTDARTATSIRPCLALKFPKKYDVHLAVSIVLSTVLIGEGIDLRKGWMRSWTDGTFSSVPFGLHKHDIKGIGIHYESWVLSYYNSVLDVHAHTAQIHGLWALMDRPRLLASGRRWDRYVFHWHRSAHDGSLENTLPRG